MEYTKQIVKGATWIGALRLGTRAISFLRTFLLARLLDPVQFGAFGIASLVLALLETLTETGINVVLIQAKEKTDQYIDSAWIVSLTRGFVIGSIIFLSAPFIASFFNAQESLPVLTLMAIVPLIRGFINPSVVKLQKNLLFHKDFLYRLVIFSVEAGTAIIFALITHDAISLVLGLVIGACFEVVLSFLFLSPRPRIQWEKTYLQFILHKGKWVSLNGIFTYLFQNFDNIVVGRLLGSSSLGFYQMAYTISLIPMTEVSETFSKVAFPVYATISHDRKKIRNTFLKTLIITCILTAPAGLLLFFFTKEIVLLLLGEKWLPIVDVLKILAFFGVIRALVMSSTSLFYSMSQQKVLSGLTGVSFCIMAVLIVPLVQAYQLTGAAYAAFLATVASIPFVIYFLRRIFTQSSQ